MWKRVTNVNEVNNGNRIRYRMANQTWFGEDPLDARFVGNKTKGSADSVDVSDQVMAEDIFSDSEWDYIEVWVDPKMEKTTSLESYYLFTSPKYILREGDEKMIKSDTRKSSFSKVNKSEIGKMLGKLNKILLIRRQVKLGE